MLHIYWNVLSNNDGCIISRSQEAKDLGIPMGAPLHQQQDVIRKHGVRVFSSNYTLYEPSLTRENDELIKYFVRRQSGD